MQKGSAQEVEAAGFEQEVELATCWGPFQPELSYDLMSFPWQSNITLHFTYQAQIKS